MSSNDSECVVMCFTPIEKRVSMLLAVRNLWRMGFESFDMPVHVRHANVGMSDQED